MDTGFARKRISSMNRRTHRHGKPTMTMRILRIRRPFTFREAALLSDADPDAMRSLLNNLQRLGRLERVKAGTLGRYGKPAVYKVKL